MTAPPTEASADPATLRVDRRAVEALFARGLVSAQARDHALALIEPPRDWGLWVSRILTVFGVALILSGIVYFFAFNWDAIPPSAKLGGVAALLLAAVGTALVLGFEGAPGRILVTVATVLVGVFLAVFGQIYQTGADAWGLFFAWAALTLVWALLSNFAATWAVWLVVADLAIWLWWAQTQQAERSFYAGATLSLMLFDGLALGLREILVARGVSWPAAHWTRIFLVVPTLATATFAAIAYIGHYRDVAPIERASAATAVVVVLAALVVYRRHLPDIMTLALATMAACVLLVSQIFELMSRATHGADMGGFFVTGLFTLAVFAAAVAWLRRVSRDMEAEHG